MTTMRDICLGIAVAGVVAGAGSAVGTAVAAAESPGPDSSTSAGPADSPSVGSPAQNRSRGHSAKPKPKPAAAAATDAKRDVPRFTPRPARAVSAPVQPTRVDPVSETETAATTPAPVAAPLAVNAIPKLPLVPALPRPALLPLLPMLPMLPLLPMPALPVAPAGATAVSATGTSARARAAAAVAVQTSSPPPTHVILIGTDGTNLSKILSDPSFDTGGFKIVMDNGVTGATSIVGHTTISGPSWSTIMTGTWDTKTGVINNLFNPAPYDSWPTAINLLEYNDSSIDTAVFADWKYIHDMGDAGGYPADVNEFVEFDTSWENTDDLVVDKTIDQIRNTSGADSAFIFSYQVAVDEAGHAYGGGSPEYAAAVTNTSDNIRRIMEEIAIWEADPANAGQEWTVIVTTDHGHQQSQGFGHGFQSPNETSSFVMFDIEGDDSNDGKQNLAYSTTDITPTIVDLFGFAQRSDFDGVPLTDKASSIIDPVDLKKSLNDAIRMYGYPNIGTDIALGTRTVFASIPYFIDGFVTDITAQLQSIVSQDIFLISGVAAITKLLVQVTGDAIVAVTQAVARVVAHLTGAGTIPPTSPPLTPPSNGAVPTPAQLPAAVLV